MKTILILLMALTFTGCTSSQHANDDLQISIQVTKNEDGLIDIEKEIIVTLKNVSDKDLNIWDDACSWGYSCFEFEIKTSNNLTFKIQKYSFVAWTMNYPQTILIKSGESYVEKIKLTDGTWAINGDWVIGSTKGKDVAMGSRDIVEIKATYQITEGAGIDLDFFSEIDGLDEDGNIIVIEGEKIDWNLWYGKVETSGINIELLKSNLRHLESNRSSIKKELKELTKTLDEHLIKHPTDIDAQLSYNTASTGKEKEIKVLTKEIDALTLKIKLKTLATK